MVEELLQTLVGVVDAQLFERVVLKTTQWTVQQGLCQNQSRFLYTKTMYELPQRSSDDKVLQQIYCLQTMTFLKSIILVNYRYLITKSRTRPLEYTLA